MAFTPQDIHHKEFRSARFGGYNEEEVDSFLDLVADEFERMVHENTDMVQQLELVRKRVAEFEEMQTSLQSALLAATRSAEVIREQARQEAEATVNKAQEEADSLIRGAQEQSRQMTLRAHNERQKLERDFARLRDIKRRYLDSLRQIAEGHLREVEDLESKTEEAETVAEVVVRPSVEAAAREAAPVAPQTPRHSAAGPLQDAPLPDTAEQKVAETPAPEPEPAAVQPEIVPVADVHVATLDAQPPLPVQGREPAGAPDVETVEPPAVSHIKGAELERDPAPPVSAPGEKEEMVAEERVQSSQLVDEVLQMDPEDNPYADYPETGDEGDEREAGGRKAKKEKRDKHFFWE